MTVNWEAAWETQHLAPYVEPRVEPRNSKSGRGGGIRTPDPLVPNQMRYQAALRPDGNDYLT